MSQVDYRISLFIWPDSGLVDRGVPVLVLALGLLVPMALLARAAAGRWLRPGSLFAGYWLVAGIAPLALFESPRVNARAIVYIFVAVAIFTLGAITSAWSGKHSRPHLSQPLPAPNHGLLLGTILIGTLAGFGAGLLALRVHGLSASMLLSTDGVLETGNSIAVARYSGQPVGSPLTAALLALAYGSALVAPYATVLDSTIKRIWLFAPVTSVLFYATITTERLGLLIAGACTIGGYIAARTLKDGDAPKVSRRGIAAAATVVCAIGAAFIGIAFVRVGSVDAEVVPVIREKVAVYAFGYEPAFSEWLDAHEGPSWKPRSLGWGTASIAGASALTGQSRSETRAYSQFTAINEQGRTTNIYTIFRGLLIDFGRPGTAVAIFLFGLGAGAAYRRATIDRSPLSAGLLGCLYAMIFTSNIMSILSFTNVLVGMTIAVCILRSALHLPSHS